MQLKNKKKYNEGFSVIEVLITLFLIGVTLMLFQATANALVLNKYGRFREIALRIADQKLQTVRTTPFASIPATGSFSDPLLVSIPNGNATITTTDISERLKDVTITVTWTKPTADGSQQIVLQTYIYQGGLGQ